MGMTARFFMGTIFLVNNAMLNMHISYVLCVCNL